MASFRVLRHFTRQMSDTGVTVNVVQGALRGRKTSSKFGEEYVTFRGVPYAKPPIGALRFQAPEPMEPWSGVRDAMQEGEVCPQKDLFTQKMRGAEDCLFLNIHTPKMPEGESAPLKPVIVWIPGGTFTTGHGNADVYGPEFIVREDVILVTINYRVGALGFLSLEEAGISGNAGLKDQVSALRWIQQNIRRFGGDPRNVTLAGDSAGSCCVSYHMLSPMSRGLFARAVSLSGTALNPYAFMDTSTSHKRAFALGEVFGCKSQSQQELADCLLKASAIDISANLPKALTKTSNKRGEAFPFLPTVETGTGRAGEEIFLPDTPFTMFGTGQSQSLPYMISTSSDEGLLLIRNLLVDPTRRTDMDKNFEKCIVMPLDLGLERYSEESVKLAERIREFYHIDTLTTEQGIVDYSKLSTDAFFTTGVTAAINKHIQFSSAPTYFCEFGFSGSLGLYKKLLGTKGLPGACHGDILGYLFTTNMLKHNLPEDSREMKTVNTMVGLLTNFAKSGNPTPKGSPVTWEPTTFQNKLAYLEIRDEVAMKCEREKERMDFWDDVYRRYGNKYETVVEEPRLTAQSRM